MRIKTISLFILLFFTDICFADSPVIWWVWGSSFTPANLATIQAGGKFDDKLAVNDTYIDPRICNGTTNYYVIISTVQPAVNTFLKNQSALGKILRLGDVVFNSNLNPITGQVVQSVDFNMIPNLPYEFNNLSYSVSISS